jgi:hypothetical protein
MSATVRGRRLVSSDEAIPAKKQHVGPCSDCPMSLDLKRVQCAGMAIYRANVCKHVDAPGLRLPKNEQAVFSTPMEFLDHHNRKSRHG